jgi:hypothetical protein
MNSLSGSFRVIEKVLKDYADFLGSDDQVQIECVFDREQGHYLLVEVGWEDHHRIYSTLIHIDVIDQKLWIQQDSTEEGVTEELLAGGIAPDQIVLAFQSSQLPKNAQPALF